MVRLTLPFAVLFLAAQSNPPADLEHSLEKQAREHPNSFQANRDLGEFYTRQKKFSAAAVYLGRAFELDKSSYGTAYDLGLSQLLAGNLPAARSTAADVLGRTDRADFHNLLGSIEEASGNFREAAKEFETAARQDPSEKNLFDLGTELLKYHGYPQAVKILQYAVEKYPRSAKLRVSLGVAEYSIGSYRSAVETLCQAVDLDPQDARALEFLGKMHDAAPELSSDVTRRLKHFAELYPENPAANYYYALALKSSQSTSPPQVEALLEKAVAEDPTFAEAHYELALSYADSGADTQAMSELRIAIRLRPDLKSAHYHLAQLYTKHHAADLAQREYDAVKALSNH